MKLTYLTLFPENFYSFQHSVLVERAQRKKVLETQVIDIRDYAKGSYRHLDDNVYGDGAGMVLKCEPILNALKAVRSLKSHVLIVDPCGTPFTQSKARELSSQEDIIFLCGHYEGYDARIYDYATECISLGDYILSQGELASQVISDALIRLLPGVLRKESTEVESFEMHRLEHYQYTKPRIFEGKAVPEVLLSGNHEQIARYNQYQSLIRTRAFRKDLLEKYPLSEEERKILEEFEGQ